MWRSQGFLPCIQRYLYWMSQLRDLTRRGRDEILDQVAQLHEKHRDDSSSGISQHGRCGKLCRPSDRDEPGGKMLDGTPQSVFRHYKELEAVGLAAPQVTYVMHDLKEKGFEVSADAATVEEAADEIMKLKQTPEEKKVQA